ncbi:MAG: 30S ribosome-binding factor RbfA [Anaerolineae bacterium]|nr:30S ribosome-binding factor RbfA [Anaerolineae bacterium]
MPDLTVRQRRVADLIARELSLVLQQRAADPGLAGAVVTGARVSGDLRQAVVFVTSVLPEEKGTIMEALTRSEAFLRHELAGRVQLRHVPALTFRLDDTYDHAKRIESILDELAPALAEPEDEEEEDEE